MSEVAIDLQNRVLELTRENQQLREAFVDLFEEAKDMRCYVPDYFAKKWKHDEALTRAQAVIDRLASEASS